MFSYLSRNNLYQVDPVILYRLAPSQGSIGSLVLRLLNSILDDFITDGRPFSVPWNIVFPPSVTERFNVRYQLSRSPKHCAVERKFMLVE
jgi:hypothetical protein